MTDLEPPKTLGEFLLELDSVGSWLVATALAGLFVGVPLLLIRNAIGAARLSLPFHWRWQFSCSCSQLAATSIAVSSHAHLQSPC